MSQSLETQTPSIDQQPTYQIDLDMVKMTHRQSNRPNFLFHEKLADEQHEYVTGVAIVDASDGKGMVAPVGFKIDPSGKMEWRANGIPQPTGETLHPVGMVLVREDGVVEQLGVDAQAGVVEDLHPSDELYVLPEELIEKMKETDTFKKNGFELISKDEEIAVDLVQVTFDEAIVPSTKRYTKEEEQKRQAVIKDRQNRRRSKAERSQKATLVNNKIDTQDEYFTLSDEHATLLDDLYDRLHNPDLSVKNGTTPDDDEAKEAFIKEHGYFITDSRGVSVHSEEKSNPTPGKKGNQNRATASSEPETKPLIPQKAAHEIDPAVEGAEAKLASLRGQMAAVSAKRQGRLFGKSGEYEQLQAEYNTQLVALGKMKLAEVIANDALTDSQKNVAVISYIFDEQQQLREQTKEVLKDTKVSKFIEWFNSGTKGQRFRRGVYLGLGGVIVGAGLGAVAGVAAGAGIAGAATATAVSGTRFARYFAKKDNQQGRGMEQIENQAIVQHKSETMKRLEGDSEADKLATASNYFTDLFERDTKAQQEKRRKSVRAGLAGVAIGAVAGGLAAEAASQGFDAIGEWSNRNLPTSNAEALSDHATDASIEENAGESNGVADGGQSASGEVPAADGYEFSSDAFTVSNGEGWYQTFADMGITDTTEQAELLQKVGPVLQEKGWAYPMGDGTWGISRPGILPSDVLELIKNSR